MLRLIQRCLWFIRTVLDTTIIYSNDLKIAWNQVTTSSCALGSASRLAQQSKTLPTMPSQHKTHLRWPRPRLSEQLNKYLQKEHTAWFLFRNESDFMGISAI